MTQQAAADERADHDLVIRGGTVVDGTGVPPRVADVAIDRGQIVAVGEVLASGRDEVDASGLFVTPGWVDIHTTTTVRPRGIPRSHRRRGRA